MKNNKSNKKPSFRQERSNNGIYINIYKCTNLGHLTFWPNQCFLYFPGKTNPTKIFYTFSKKPTQLKFLTPSQKINLLSTFERTDSWAHRIYYTLIKKLIILFQMFTTNIHFLYLMLSFSILNWLLFFIFCKIFI